jgi:protocatechuate 3,4-dioxygenase beta subunit
MLNDDEPIGRILSRREILKLLGATGLAVLVGCGPDGATTGQATSTAVPAVTSGATQAPATTVPEVAVAPTCVVRPEQTEGPYFVDERLDRSDIRSDPSSGEVKAGLPLALTFAVSQISSSACAPLSGAIVDVWHCDAAGSYSGVQDRSFDTTGQQWLRGYQVTNDNGIAQFTSIFPGWYSGRTVHIHFKIRTGFDEANSYEFTSQLYFDKSFVDQVYAQEPYAARGEQNTLNSADGIYSDELLLTATMNDSGAAATFDIALDLSDA